MAIIGHREPPLYRPFALAAFAATVAGGTPLGIWMLFWLYRGAAAVPVEWVLLHAHLQVFGFFATLIPGVAQHLFPRFTGRPVERQPAMHSVFALLAAGLLLRGAATWLGAPAVILAASLVQAAGLSIFARWVWRALDPLPLAPLRRHLAASTGWLALGCLLEAALRGRALGLGLAVPDREAMGAVYAMGLLGGALGWVLGVLLRAGPMFVRGWATPRRAVHLVPGVLALAVVVASAGALGDWSGSAGMALRWTGELLALGAVMGVLLPAGALGRASGMLPMAARSPEEARIFRLAVLSAGLALVGAAAGAAAAWSGTGLPLLADAVRHLLTVGFLTSVVVAMAFRLIPVLEGRPLPWPRLRPAAFWALLLAVLIRSAEVLVGLGWAWLAPWIPLSGLLVWLALAGVGASLIGALPRARRAP